MELRSNGKFICTRPMESLFTQGEKNADIIDFIIPKINNGVDLSECDFMMAGVNIQKVYVTSMLAKSIEDSNIRLSWTVSEQFTAVPGMLMLEIRGTKGNDVIVRYSLPAVYVKEQLEGDTVAVEGSAIDDLMQQIQAALSSANSANETASELLQQIGNTQENLQKYDGTANEVEAARECSVLPNEGTVSGTLKERLAADFSSVLQMISSSEKNEDIAKIKELLKVSEDMTKSESLDELSSRITKVNTTMLDIAKLPYGERTFTIGKHSYIFNFGSESDEPEHIIHQYLSAAYALPEFICRIVDEYLGDIKTALEAIVEVNE